MLKYNYFSNNCHFLPKKVFNCHFFISRLYAIAEKKVSFFDKNLFINFLPEAP